MKIHICGRGHKNSPPIEKQGGQKRAESHRSAHYVTDWSNRERDRQPRLSTKTTPHSAPAALVCRKITTFRLVSSSYSSSFSRISQQCTFRLSIIRRYPVTKKRIIRTVEESLGYRLRFPVGILQHHFFSLSACLQRTLLAKGLPFPLRIKIFCSIGGKSSLFVAGSCFYSAALWLSCQTPCCIFSVVALIGKNEFTTRNNKGNAAAVSAIIVGENACGK